MASYGTPEDKQSDSLSIEDLQRMAELASQKNLQHPVGIESQLRYAITACQRITKHYKANHPLDTVTTENHEFFTNRQVEIRQSNSSRLLAGIYNLLFPHTSQPENRAMSPSQRSESQVQNVLNRFECLNTQTPNEETDYSGKSTSQTLEAKIPHIKHDLLSESLEILDGLQEVQNLILTVEKAWENAAQGSAHWVVAAVVTNAAFAAITPIDLQLQQYCEKTNPVALSIKLGATHEAVDASMGLLETLQLSWRLLKRSSKEKKSKQEMQPLTVKTPTEFFHTANRVRERTDQECMFQLLQGIRYRAAGENAQNIFFDKTSPVVLEISGFLKKNQSSDRELKLAAGLVLWNETCKQFFSTSPENGKLPNCRLEAIRFALEIIPDLDAILGDLTMPGVGEKTIAGHLSYWRSELKSFFSEQIFDLHSQSPWICANQVLEMLRVTAQYGCLFLTHGQYFGAVMHSYNILRQFGKLDGIPLFEKLINRFEEQNVFGADGRPSRNFHSCAMIYCGGRLEFKKNPSHEKFKYELVIPGQRYDKVAAMFVEPNAQRFDLPRASIMWAMHLSDYHPTEKMWEFIDDSARNRIADIRGENDTEEAGEATEEFSEQGEQSRKQVDELAQQADESGSSKPSQTDESDDFDQYNYIPSPSHRIHHLMLMVQGQDFRPDFPFARLNFFKIYLAYVKVAKIVSGKYRSPDHGQFKHIDACRCFFEDLLEAADKYKGSGQKVDEVTRMLFEHVAGAIEEVFGRGKMEDWLWNGV